MKYTLYSTENQANITGDKLTMQEWQSFVAASSTDSRKPASYAVYKAIVNAIHTAYRVAEEKDIKVVDYQGTEIEDDGRIANAIDEIRLAVATRAAKLAQQPLPPQYLCAGNKDGCRTRVYSNGDYCERCNHDNQ